MGRVRVSLDGRGGRRGPLAPEDPGDPVDSSTDAARQIARPELRQHRGSDDFSSQTVRENALEPVAHFNADTAIQGSDEDEDAIVALRIADAPIAEEPMCVLLYRHSLE
jgi:hypothetical protein